MAGRMDPAGIGNKKRQVFGFLAAVLSYAVHRPDADLFRPVHRGEKILHGMPGIDELLAEQLFRADAGG